MICEKCGMEYKETLLECPRCGYIPPKKEIVRIGVEEGSVDAWTNKHIPQLDETEEESSGFSLSDFFEKHPSAVSLSFALGIRVIFYILVLLCGASPWKGVWIIANVLAALAASFIIVTQPEERDFYWFKPTVSVLVLSDAILTVIAIILPIVIKILSFFVK